MSETNALTIRYPEVAAEWHPNLNPGKEVSEVTYGSGDRVWWQCATAPEHEWTAVVCDRTISGSGCPYCTVYPRSRQEVVLAYEIALFYEVDLTTHTVVRGITPVDIVLPNESIVVEFDGAYWHRGKEADDLAKTNLLLEAGWNVIRIRQEPLGPVGPFDVVVPPEPLDMKRCSDVMLEQLAEVSGAQPAGLDDYLRADTIQNGDAAERFLQSIRHAAPTD